jgi:hypothetical protein
VPHALSRRRLLAGAASALTTSACGVHAGQGPAVPSATPDALEPLLTAELALIAQYDAALASHGAALRAVRDEHAAHAQALRALLDPRRARAVPSAAPATGGPPALAALASAEKTAAQRAAAACLAAPAERAELLASIAASEASHAVVLAAVRDRGSS